MKTEIQKLSFSDNFSTISRDKVLQLILLKSNCNNAKYKLSELLLHNVDIEPNNIQSYTNNNSVNLWERGASNIQKD